MMWSSASSGAALWGHDHRRYDASAAHTENTPSWRKSSYQTDFDAVHHESQNGLLKALFACRWESKRHWGGRDGGGATLVRLLARLCWEELLVRRVRNIQQVKEILAHICRRRNKHS